MNKKLIKTIMENRTADKATMDILLRLPDEAYDKLKYITENSFENGADWAKRQFQGVIRKYLSDDEKLMQLIDEDECRNTESDSLTV